MKSNNRRTGQPTFSNSSLLTHVASSQEIQDTSDEILDFVDLMAQVIGVKNHVEGTTQGMCTIQKNKKTSKLHMYVSVTIGSKHVGYAGKHATLEDCEKAAYMWINHLAASYQV